MPEAALSVLYESTIKCGLLSASKHCLFCFPHMNKVELELYCSVGNLRSVPCSAHCIVVFAQRRESMTDCETVQRSQNSSHHKRTYSRRVP